VVASGTFGGPIETQAAFVRQMAEIVDAVVVLVCQMATEEEDDTVWRANTAKLLELTGDVPLGLYECALFAPLWSLCR
jgi:4-hydroxy-tetrahydrodipicolinate synthase